MKGEHNDGNIVKHQADYPGFKLALQASIASERIVDDPLRTLAYGTDASFYRLIPTLVVTVKDEHEVIVLLKLAKQFNVSLTFRAAGTSLSGQAVTDAVLVRLGYYWRDQHVLDQGAKICLQPGVVGAEANNTLKPLGRKIGPDPASINSAQIGGIAANNASGMCCGTRDNSYQTLDSMRLILADGAVLDTGDTTSRQQFKQTHRALINELTSFCNEVKDDPDLSELIRQRYRIKNTTGYGLNALLDYTDPIDVIAHLMIGSEGTLGFISSITYNTVEDHAHKASALLFYANIDITTQAVAALAKSTVTAVELMDRAALHAIENEEGIPTFISALDEQAAALLIEVRDSSAEGLQRQIESVSLLLKAHPTVEPFAFSTDEQVCSVYWNIRKGLFPAVGAMRDIGTTVIIEDVAFPIVHLAAAVNDLQALFVQHGYQDAIIFGHALEGNLHFVFTQDFSSNTEILRYSHFMDAVCEMVVGYRGSLKAEHGTGRNIAPYVQLEWGTKAYSVMQRIKRLLDPDTLLNPDVIITNNPSLHLENLKPLFKAHPLIDRCTECGFCENVCPSRRLTLTPRQRIAVVRELAAYNDATTLEQKKNTSRYKEILSHFDYMAIDTCAADGMCATTCPIDINTGDLVRELRSQRNQRYRPLARWLSRYFGGLTRLTHMALRLGGMLQTLLGQENVYRLFSFMRRLSGNRLPRWGKTMPGATMLQGSADSTTQGISDVVQTCRTADTNREMVTEHRLRWVNTPSSTVVYFPSCASRVMGPSHHEQDRRSLVEVTHSLCNKAGIVLRTPDKLSSLCCGMPFESKGHFDVADDKLAQLNQALLDASDNGRHPVLMDTSPCSFRSENTLDPRITLYEPITFALEYLVPALSITPCADPIMLHITCSTRKQGLSDSTEKLARQLCQHIVVPKDIECCAFAGDKGFSVPQLNASALEPLASQVPGNCREGVSTSRTCEIGLSEHSGVNYHSILYLLDRVSSARGP